MTGADTVNARRLNELAGVIDAASYLEIGVQHGRTFERVEIARKVGVDPRFRFDPAPSRAAGHDLHEVTSEEYFRSVVAPEETFDLILLDGLHTFEQTFRDLCASLAHAHVGTVWLIDDTWPTSRLAAQPDPRVTSRLRRLLRISDRAWMGDVYKIVPAIHDLFPQLSYATYPNHGATVVWRQQRARARPAWASLRAITRLDYRAFRRDRDAYWDVRPPADILDAVRAARLARQGRSGGSA